jgi:hypothetical protein
MNYFVPVVMVFVAILLLLGLYRYFNRLDRQRRKLFDEIAHRSARTSEADEHKRK